MEYNEMKTIGLIISLIFIVIFAIYLYGDGVIDIFSNLVHKEKEDDK